VVMQNKPQARRLAGFFIEAFCRPPHRAGLYQDNIRYEWHDYYV